MSLDMFPDKVVDMIIASANIGKKPPCDNCDFRSYTGQLEEVRGFKICPLCVKWLEWSPSRVLECEKESRGT